MRHHGEHRDPLHRPPEAGRPDLHRGPPGDWERRQARRGASEGQAREQRDALRQEERRQGPRPAHGRLPGPDAGGPVRAQRLHLAGAEETRRAARVHARRVRHGPHGDEAARPRRRDGRRPREGDGEVRRRLLAGRARRGDRRRERTAPGPRAAVRHAGGVPDGRDVRVLRRPEVRAGRARCTHEVLGHRDLLQRAGEQGEADRPDHVEAEGHRGRTRDSGQARGPRVHRLMVPGRGPSSNPILLSSRPSRLSFIGFDNHSSATYREPEARTGEVYRLEAPRGDAFYVCVLCVAVFGFFETVSLIGIYQGDGDLWIAAAFGIFVAGGMAGVMYYRPETDLTVDSQGVRVRRGSRIRKEIPWQTMIRVRFGTRVIPGYGARVGAFLEIKGPHFRDHLDIDRSSYRISEFDVAEFALRVAREAERRGVRVEQKDVR